MQSFANWPIVVNAPINVAELGTGVCRMEYFTEREFSGIFSLAGGGEFCIFEKGIPGGPDPLLDYDACESVYALGLIEIGLLAL